MDDDEDEITRDTKQHKSRTSSSNRTDHPKRPEDPDAAPPRQLRARGDRRDQVDVRRRPVRSRDEERFQHLSHCLFVIEYRSIEMYKSRSFLLKKQKRGWCLRTQKKSLRKNPKLKRRNIKKKDIFQSQKITRHLYIVSRFAC